MRIAAVLLAGSHFQTNGPTDTFGPLKPGAPETLSGVPIAGLDILGRSPVERTMERLTQAGITVSVLADTGLSPLFPRPLAPVGFRFVPATDTWMALKRTIEGHLALGFQTILIMRLGAYVELDIADVLKFHREQNRRMVRVYDHRGPLDIWLLDATRWSSDFAQFSGSNSETRQVSTPYYTRGYVNRLTDAHDVRCLVVDSFLGHCDIRPNGTERKPGVWVAQGAQLHSNARVVAPAYIGRNVKVGPATLITRCSNIEAGCNIDYGTVIEDASILSDTYVGTGLDVTHSVVYGGTISHLRHKVAVEIRDEALIGRSVGLKKKGAFARTVAWGKSSYITGDTALKGAGHLVAALRRGNDQAD